MAERLKKTAELRKRVMERNKKNTQRNDSVPFQVIYLTCFFFRSNLFSIFPNSVKLQTIKFGREKPSASNFFKKHSRGNDAIKANEQLPEQLAPGFSMWIL